MSCTPACARNMRAGSGSHLELGLFAALHQDGGDAVQAIQARLDIVGGDFPKLRLPGTVLEVRL